MVTNKLSKVNKLEGGLRTRRGGVENRKAQPLVSVITVSFNSEKYIRACIESVINIAHDAVEHIIVDGNSTDETVDILREYDHQIEYWLTEKDNGIYNAMNKALKFGKGKWFLFLGSDDELLPGFSEMASLLTDPNRIYYGDYLSDNARFGGRFTSYRLSKSGICQQNIFYPIKVFKKYQFQEKYKINADHYLNIRCWMDDQFRWEYYPIVIANFSSKGISSRELDPIFETDRIGITKKYLGMGIYYRYQLRQLRKYLKKYICFMWD